MEEINTIIDQSTPTSIANAGLWGHTIQYLRAPDGPKERERFNQFTHLFLNTDATARLENMKKLHPSETDSSGVDTGHLRLWLKIVAQIMGWKDPEEIKMLLGVKAAARGELERQGKRDIDHEKANLLMDELDLEFRPTLGREGGGRGSTSS
ncbi:hypothetical protein PMZ80_001330 [Knufia obscura]|uniref:Uncharacterized protein n=1 Tax=Knufia obscura TaxID=1635080 RepID=A0ABR0S3V5_9EURO|nr:hypothetical protein PMZ80_001330 [Knufia obscura]